MERDLKLVLVGGIPGTKSPRVIEILLNWLKTNISDANRWVMAPKFEDFLVDEYNRTTDSRIGNINPLLELPKPILRDLWSDTVDVLADYLRELVEKSTTVEYVLIPIHLTWFHQDLREYIEVLDALKLRQQLKPHRIVHVLCLIDDIHDIYLRLREPNALYDREAAKLSENLTKRGHAFFRHLQILDWRARELGTGESVAHQLSCSLTVLATKHQPSVAYSCLSGNPQIYFSHPITEVRRLEETGVRELEELGSRLKQEVWDLQRILSTKYALLQPTCIDEFRLITENGRMALGPRFYSRSSYAQTLFEEPPGQQDQQDNVIYDDLAAEKISSITEEDTSGAADLGRIVSASVEHQVTSRDLQLVTQAHHLLVYRPRFNGNLSGGVNKEISYFDQLSKYRSRGRVVVVDSEIDAAEFPVRQLLEAMVSASQASEWDVDLEKSALPQYQLKVSSNTRRQLRDATGKDALNSVVKSILRDLGLDDRYSVGKVSVDTPLGTGVYITQQKKKEEFIKKLARSLTPLDERPGYEHKIGIKLDGRDAQAVAAEIVAAFAAPSSTKSTKGKNQ